MGHIVGFTTIPGITHTMATDERMPAIPVERMTGEQKKAAEEFMAGRGYAVLGPFAVMLRSPEVMLHAKAMGDYLRFRNVLPKHVIEMVILMTAREWTQQFEWSHHYKFAMEAGLAPEVATAIAEGRRPSRLSDDEAAAYDFTLELHRTKRVSDTSYARALELFGERGIIDLVGLSGYYSFLAMMMNVARTKPEASHGEPLRRFPE
jgi:4-carboxymuconolactone decarboxylase